MSEALNHTGTIYYDYLQANVFYFQYIKLKMLEPHVILQFF